MALVRMEAAAREEVDMRGSKTNPAEARAVVECITRLRYAYPLLFPASGAGGDGSPDAAPGVAVLTSYLGQKARIQALLAQLARRGCVREAGPRVRNRPRLRRTLWGGASLPRSW